MCRLHSLTLTAVLASALAGCSGTVADEPGPPLTTSREAPGAGPTRRALLVACSIYPALPEKFRLLGPPHDAKLLADLLEKNPNLHFPAGQIVTLADGLEARRKPTRANILRELDALAAVAGSGDQIVIMLGGHGTQQPNSGDLDDGETDGLDEVFLPVDMLSKYDAVRKTIPNAITDDEIGQKIAAIRRKGAFVWVIFDCCHSGTMIRGTDEATPRHVPIEELIPEGVLAAVQPEPAAEGSRSAEGGEDSPIELAPPAEGQGGLVVIYAALPTEKTYDDWFPRDVAHAQQTKHGLLTYAICQVLGRATEPLTYTELVQRVRQQYAQWRWASGPTPTVYGPDRDKEVLGEKSWPGRSAMRLETVGGRLEITAGALAGLSPGAILSVMALNADPHEKPLGHVKVTECSVLRATAIPLEFAGVKPPETFPLNVRLQVVRVDFGARKLRVAEDRPATIPAASGLLARLTGEGSASRDVIEVVADPRQSDWIVRVEEGQSWLVPAAGWSVAAPRSPVERGLPTPPAGAFGPFPADDNLDKKLAETFSTIARAQNLLALSEPTDGARLSDSLRVDLAVTRHQGTDDERGQPLDLSKGKVTLKPGELLGFNIANRGRRPVDVTLLFVNSGFGIKAWYPKDGDFNRLGADEKIGPPDINFARISTTTIGLEHMVLLAVAAKDAPLDFTWLAQPTLQAARDLPGVRGEAFDSPLGQLLESAAFAPGNARDAEAVEIRQSCIRTLSWKVE
jgi:hypothetical protein